MCLRDHVGSESHVHDSVLIVSYSLIAILSAKCEEFADDIHHCSLNDFAFFLSGSQSWGLNIFLELPHYSVNVHDSLDGLIG
jgi:hypothetical protein